jgi:hypothetical protein
LAAPEGKITRHVFPPSIDDQVSSPKEGVMTNIPTEPAMGFLDNPHAPDVFADSMSGLFFLNGNIRITFESARASHTSSPGPVNRVVIGRLVMPMKVAEAMARELLVFAERMRTQELQTAQSTVTIQ